MYFHVTEDEKTENGISKWKYIKWTDSFKTRASHASHAVESYEFKISNEGEKYEKKFIFRKLFEPVSVKSKHAKRQI